MASVGFDRFEALGKFDHLEPRVRTHLKNVYSCLFIALLGATAGAYLNVFFGVMQEVGFLTGLISVGLCVWLRATPHESKTVGKRIAMLTGIGFLTGVSFGPLIRYAAYLDPSIIMTAFLGASIIFGCFSLTALYSSDRKWLYLGGTLMSVLMYMTIASFLNIFFRSQLLFQAQIYIGLVLFCLFVLYDTQMIIEKRLRGDDDYIWHSIDLFLDFAHIFRYILIILSQKEEGKKKRRN
ncbi:bax inhibitor 1-like [Watersipora subatra]|uniref:bax inhibitor 1-like n=1 Tax=Watersipora subatra TaxID=2589382 RepID=UPI00355BD8C0